MTAARFLRAHIDDGSCIIDTRADEHDPTWAHVFARHVADTDYALAALNAFDTDTTAAAAAIDRLADADPTTVDGRAFVVFDHLDGDAYHDAATIATATGYGDATRVATLFGHLAALGLVRTQAGLTSSTEYATRTPAAAWARLQ